MGAAAMRGRRSSTNLFKHYRLTILCIGFIAQALLLVYALTRHPQGADQALEKTGKSNDAGSVTTLRQRSWPQPPSDDDMKSDCNCSCLSKFVQEEVQDILNSHQFSEELPHGQEWYQHFEDISAVSETNAGIHLRASRIVDKNVQQDASIPGVEDVYAQLKAYLLEQIKRMTTNMTEVRTAQHHTTAQEMGMEPWDAMEEIESIPFRIRMVNDLTQENRARNSTQICIYTTSSVDLMGVRRELLPWIQYHTELGIAHFYVLYDGHDPKAVKVLNTIDHVSLLHIHPPFAGKKEQASYEAWANMHIQWKGKPGNFELMVKQGYGTREGLKIARTAGMEWMIHMDPDEFFYPNNPSFSLIAEFKTQPSYVSSLRFMNFEGQPEIGDVKNRYEQVTLFRAHKHFITPEAYALRNKCKLGDNRSFLVLYANGKSAVRVDAPGARQLGPHYFKGDDSPRWATPENPKGLWRDKVSNTSYLLHYAYSQQSDVERKASRSCPPQFVQAALNGDIEKVQTCFIIDFDRDAFLAAARNNSQDFFYSRMVLSEGSRFKCRHKNKEGWCLVRNVEYFKALLLKSGLIQRVREPQHILRAHEKVIRLMMKSDNAHKSNHVENLLEAVEPNQFVTEGLQETHRSV